jgi:esterase/lipase superfamily enzyme
MLFITNRMLRQSLRSRAGRAISFQREDVTPLAHVFFAERHGEGDYREVGSQAFFDALRASGCRQVLFFFHGFSVPPEAAFRSGHELQQLCDAFQPGEVRVVCCIWPTDDDFGIIRDYFDDQQAADGSGRAFMRAFEKFLAWRDRHSTLDDPCRIRINVLAHSMGNRVLREALAQDRFYYQTGGLPLVFRNVFMLAPDLSNETLESGKRGRALTESTRNVVVYHASDDLAMRGSKVANVRNGIASRRLGHTGPEDMRAVPDHVHAVDCDDFNHAFDPPTGHTYFLTRRREPLPPGFDPGNAGANPLVSPAFRHLWECLMTGRVASGPERRLILGSPG